MTSPPMTVRASEGPAETLESYSICTYACSMAGSFIMELVQLVEWVAKKIINFSFYAGYNVLAPDLIEQRNAQLRDTYAAVALDCHNAQGDSIAVRYIPSKASCATGNVLVICLNTTYEDHHPRHWLPFLERGADIVLWNPTQPLPRVYEQDLTAVLRTLHEKNPDQVVGIKSYCASTDPAISAAASMPFPVHMIIDRGHGDAHALAESYSCFAKCRLVHHILAREYACAGIERITALQGRVQFFSSEVDQIMEIGEDNLTYQLAALVNQQDAVEVLSGDHWDKWGVTAYSKAFAFLNSVGLLGDTQPVNVQDYPDPAPPSWCAGTLLPVLMKTWCCC